MQHNNLYSKFNKNYNKDIELPNADQKPTQATLTNVAKSITTPDILPSTLSLSPSSFILNRSGMPVSPNHVWQNSFLC